MIEVKVDFGPRAYSIAIAPGLIASSPAWALYCSDVTVAVVTNTTVGPLYLPAVRKALLGVARQLITIELPDGESFKNAETLQSIYNPLLEARCDRKTVIVALGGGVVGDMAGYAAATFLRGVPFIQVPTTLLAQVDSSVGGKTGINHPLGKNMIGAFYQPSAVIADLDVLSTLPAREVSAGLAEIIKHAAIADAEFFAWLEANMAGLVAKNPEALAHAIARSCEIKAHLVEQDEREDGVRAYLNFGHTFGHAIEAGLGFGTWLHGEAVGAGMIQAAHLSARLGLLDSAAVERLTRLVQAADLPTVPPEFAVERWLQLMQSDKKTVGGIPQFVLLQGLGKAIKRSVPSEALVATLTASLTAATRSEPRANALSTSAPL